MLDGDDFPTWGKNRSRMGLAGVALVALTKPRHLFIGHNLQPEAMGYIPFAIMGPLGLSRIFAACLFLSVDWLVLLKTHPYHLASFLRHG